MIIRIVECSDFDTEYGSLIIKNKTDYLEVKNTIYEIKNNLIKNYDLDWNLDDILNNLPSDWDYEFYNTFDAYVIGV